VIETLLETFNPDNHLYLWLVCAFVLAFVISYVTFPTILYIAKEKHLIDEPDSRSMHSSGIPTLGGVGIFFSLVVVITLTGAMLNTKVLLLVLGGLTILFFLGLKDDLTVLSAKKKLFGQLLAASLLTIFTDTRIIGFSGILDIFELPYWASVLFTLFVYVLIVNAYNLIDGVDGLAGSIALTICAVYVILFVKAGEYSLATIAIAVIGALIPFLRLNFSKKNKIFMGDTGSMILGFLIAFFTISFIYRGQTNALGQYHHDAPVLAMAILFYPLIDTLRIFVTRVFIYKTSPFAPDKNHIHHRLVQLGYSHKATTTYLAITNILIIVITFATTKLELNVHIVALFVYGLILYSLPFLLKRFFGPKDSDNDIQSKAETLS